MAEEMIDWLLVSLVWAWILWVSVVVYYFAHLYITKKNIAAKPEMKHSHDYEGYEFKTLYNVTDAELAKLNDDGWYLFNKIYRPAETIEKNARMEDGRYYYASGYTIPSAFVFSFRRIVKKKLKK